LTFIGYVSEHKEIRDAGMSAEEKIDKYYVDLQMREDLYNAFKKFKVDSIASGEFEKLDAVKILFIY
jgi:Zn-dependent oligopeptidase